MRHKHGDAVLARDTRKHVDRFLGPILGIAEILDAAMMARMLAAVVSRGSGRPAAIPNRAIAGKTGTTQDHRDAWFIGWTEGPRGGRQGGIMIGIWLGNDDNRPTGSSSALAAGLWSDIIRSAGQGSLSHRPSLR